MNLNKIGMHVKRNVYSALNMLLGGTTKSEGEQSKIYKEVTLIENAYSGKEFERILLEAEVEKSQVVQLFILRQLQNR